MSSQFEIIQFNCDNIELSVNVSPQEDTVWLTKEQMAMLFNRDRSVISRHIRSIFSENELEEKSNVHFLHIANSDKPVQHYSLEVIISVGYRVKSKNGIIFRRWATKVLKEYLLKGYIIDENRTLLTNENYIRLINRVEALEDRIKNIENKEKLNIGNKYQLFYNGQFYDSYSFIQGIFEKANNEIIIIDNYIDRTVLDRLIIKRKEVKVIIYTCNKAKILQSDVDYFNRQYYGLELKFIDNFHDRFIIIDKTILYHLGYSIKDLGKKVFFISELNQALIPLILQHL